MRAVLIALLLAGVASANEYGIKLNPGERLISVNGKPVSQGVSECNCPRCQQRRAGANSAAPTGSDQARCQAEANEMARRGYKGHVGGVIGRFEGVGWSSSTPNCSTCTPSRGMRLTGDAVARGRDGWYRVRSWR